MKRILIGQSGGPTAAINASIAGVYVKAKEYGVERVYGMVHGIEGFLQEKLCILEEELESQEKFELLKRTPSAFLGSCRYKMPAPSQNPEVYEKIFALLEKYEIDAMFYAGGNDSMDTVKMLADYAKAHGKRQLFLGVPKTIDNDLPVTDHCPGYGSVAKYIATSVKEVMRDNESFGASKPTVCIIETMGRNAGWIAAASALSRGEDCVGPDAIYLPELPFSVDAFLEKVKELATYKSSIVLVISEGIRVADGRYVCEIAGEASWVDSFGHKTTNGSANYLAALVKKETGLKARVVEISSLQRAASHMASLRDIEEAVAIGGCAMKAAMEGHTGEMIVTYRSPGKDYACSFAPVDIHQIANVEKKLPREWITPEGNDVTEAFIEYARPLIEGELLPIYENGIPKHLIRKEMRPRGAKE